MKSACRAGRWIVPLLVAIALCLTALPGRTDIYRWQDGEGNWHFSDSPTSEAPIRQPPMPSVPRPDAAAAPPEARSAPRESIRPYTPPAPAGEEPMPAASSDASLPGGGMLWRVTADSDAVNYLLGTIHSADPRVVQLRPAVAGALDRCDRFVMEMEMDAAAMMAFGTNMMLTDGRDLETLLGIDLYTQAVNAMNDLGMPEMVVRTLKPWVVMALLSMPKPTGEPFLDLVLRQRAAEAGKPTTGLETAGEQLAVFESLSMPDQIALLKMTIAQLPRLPRMFDQLIEAYAADDLGRIAKLAAMYRDHGDLETVKRFMLRLNDERNVRMARRMQSYLNRGNSFIAVGALHLPGPSGLIQLLRDQGYRVDPVP